MLNLTEPIKLKRSNKNIANIFQGSKGYIYIGFQQAVSLSEMCSKIVQLKQVLVSECIFNLVYL